eukprot:scpid59211/ scgid5700/ GTP-binding protein YPTC1
MSSVDINTAMVDRASTCSGVQHSSGVEELQCRPALQAHRPYKIALTGNCGVGKTSLACRLSNPDWIFQQVKSTIGMEYRHRMLKVGDQLVKLHLCDTQGEERFGRVTTSFYRVAHAVFLVFDVTNYETFQDLLFWTDEVLTYQRSEQVVKTVIGNKSDVASKREVDEETAKAFAESRGLQYFETSACNGDNIEDLLQDVCHKMIGFSCTGSGSASSGNSHNGTNASGFDAVDGGTVTLGQTLRPRGSCLSC